MRNDYRQQHSVVTFCATVHTAQRARKNDAVSVLQSDDEFGVNQQKAGEFNAMNVQHTRVTVVNQTRKINNLLTSAGP